jgi:hypothetical protein
MKNIETEDFNYDLIFSNKNGYKGYFHEEIVDMEIEDKKDFLKIVQDIVKIIDEMNYKQNIKQDIYYTRFCYRFQLKNENDELNFGYCTKMSNTYNGMKKNLILNLKRLYQTFDRYNYIYIYRIEMVNRSK